MDACKASNCCHGARSVRWTEVPAVPSARVMTAVPVPVPAGVVAAAGAAAVPRPARGVPQRRWRSWISSPQRRPTRLSIPWTNELLPHSTTNHSIFSIDSPLMGEFFWVLYCSVMIRCRCFVFYVANENPELFSLSSNRTMNHRSRRAAPLKLFVCRIIAGEKIRRRVSNTLFHSARLHLRRKREKRRRTR